MKSLIVLSQLLLQDLGKLCGVSTTRDEETLTRRLEHEGVSFITITLPSFGKDLEKALDQGGVDDDMFGGFSRHAGLPRFLGGFLRLVFHSGTGVLLDTPSISAIRSLRQFCHAFGKVEIPCSPERVSRAIARYVECELELREHIVNRSLEADFSRVSLLLYGDLFEKLTLLIKEGSMIPRHGPGATADKLTGNGKFYQSEWTERLESVFPAGENLIPNWRYWPELQRTEFHEPGNERPVRVITVPKTLKTPRIIAIEPTCMQYMQQAISSEIVDFIEGDPLLTKLIGFRDQLPNQEMARIGSLSGDLATLDLSEASDRVLARHVEALTAYHPLLTEALMATRSSKAEVPNHGVIPLVKFASMGSALCFPIEAMVFCTIIFLAVEQGLGRRLTRKDVKSYASRVRVYGDDIIVPSHMAQSVSSMLSAFALKVNVDKSFWTGRFRESCGGDFYDGERVTPVRVREPLPEHRRHVSAVISTVSLRNQLFELGLEGTVDYLDRILERILPVYPELPRGHAALGRWTHEPVMASGWDAALQRPVVKAFVPVSTLPSSPLEGYPALMKFFLAKGEKPLAVDAFRRAGRSEAVHMKLRKVPLHMGEAAV